MAAAPPVDPNLGLIAAVNALTTLITTLNAAGTLGGGAVAAPTAATPLLDPFASTLPFDLASRAGSSAFNDASAPLDVTWDGTPDTFPSFIISLRIRAAECNWNAPAPQGIISIGTRNLLTDYHSVPLADVTAATANRTDPRAIQNNRALYRALKASILGDLRVTLFDQAGNLLTAEDGVSIFATLTTFTTVASLQLSMLSFKNILEFDPAVHEFRIPIINTKLNHLFVLATTQHRSLDESERVQHTLTVYGRIQQPEAWAQWVRNQIDRFDENLITNCQSFMNSAVIKYTKISSLTTDGFKGSSNTLQEDIVAMVASAKRKRAAPANVHRDSPSDTSTDSRKSTSPPFLRHFKTSAASDAKPYVVGHSKVHDGTTYYVCDCPLHRNKVKWHTHTTAECQTPQRWIADADSPPETIAAPAAVDDTTVASRLTDDASRASTPSQPTDALALLASALNLVGDNDMAKDFIADAYNILNDAAI